MQVFKYKRTGLFPPRDVRHHLLCVYSEVSPIAFNEGGDQVGEPKWTGGKQGQKICSCLFKCALT